MDRLATRKVPWRRVEGESKGRGGKTREREGKTTDTATALALALAQFRETEWTLARNPGPTIWTATGASPVTAHRAELDFFFFFFRVPVTADDSITSIKASQLILILQYTWDVWEEGDTYE